jgi:hypothetical protein
MQTVDGQQQKDIVASPALRLISPSNERNADSADRYGHGVGSPEVFDGMKG